MLYLHDGDGPSGVFDHEARAISAPVEISRRLAVGDLDPGGDLDVVVSSAETPPRVYRNDAPPQGVISPAATPSTLRTGRRLANCAN